MSNRYWVYVNEPNDKALVHEAICSYCNDGKGVAAEKLASNGRWHGPFTKDQAKQTALKSGKSKIQWCGHCARRLDIKTGLQ